MAKYTAWDSGAYIGVQNRPDWRKGPGSRTARRAKYLEGLRTGRHAMQHLRSVKAGSQWKPYERQPHTVASARDLRSVIKENIRAHAAGTRGINADFARYAKDIEYRLGFMKATGASRGPSTFKTVTKKSQGKPIGTGRNLGSFKTRQGSWKKGEGGRFVGSGG
jgi:hypothetical protein